MSFFDYREGSQSISSTLAFFYHTMEDKVMPLEANRHERTNATGRKATYNKRISQSEEASIQRLLAKGLSPAEISRMVGRHKSSIYSRAK